MEVKEFLDEVGIEVTKELLENPKMKQLVDFIERNNISYICFDEYINPKKFEYFIENMNSLENIIEVLCNSAYISTFNYNYDKYVELFNIYDSKKVSMYGGNKALIFIDEEYLKYASVEWTQDILFKSNKIINLKKDRVVVETNKLEREDKNYIAPIELNIQTLLKAKEQGRLKEVISHATRSM